MRVEEALYFILDSLDGGSLLLIVDIVLVHSCLPNVGVYAVPPLRICWPLVAILRVC